VVPSYTFESMEIVLSYTGLQFSAELGVEVRGTAREVTYSGTDGMMIGETESRIESVFVLAETEDGYYLIAREVVIVREAPVAIAGTTTSTTTETTAGGPPSTVGLAFTEATAEAGLSFLHATPFSEEDYLPSMSVAKMISGGAAADFDNDGDVDVFLIGGGTASDALFTNDGTGRFTDVTAAAGIAGEPHLGAGAAVGDYDGDGWLDLYVTSHGTPLAPETGRHRLWHNNGDGTFTDVAESSGVATTSTVIADGFGAVFGDYDLDGDLDLFVAGWEREGAGNRLFANQGDGTFTDVTGASGIVDDGIRGFSPCLTDTDGDFYPELLLVADFGTSRYFINDADGTFTEATHNVGAGLEWSGMGTATADVDNNGLIDWYTSAIYDNEAAGRGDGNKLYLNEGNHRFREVAAAAGVDDGGWGWGTVAVDLDHDGWIDLAEVNGWHFEGFETYTNDPARLFLSNGDGTFRKAGAAVGFAHDGMGLGLLAFDADGDGDYDLGVTSPNAAFLLYRNDLVSDSAWLRVLLDTGGDPAVAPNGVGARVRVTMGDTTLTRLVGGCSNYLTGLGPEAHFGLGAVSTVDLVVEWPDGAVTRLNELAVNQVVTVTR